MKAFSDGDIDEFLCFSRYVKIRRKIELQGGCLEGEVDKAVDGADIETAEILEELDKTAVHCFHEIFAEFYRLFCNAGPLCRT